MNEKVWCWYQDSGITLEFIKKIIYNTHVAQVITD